MKGRGFLSSMVLFQKHNDFFLKKSCRKFPSIRRNHTLLGAVEVTLCWLLNWRTDSKAKIEVTLGSPSSAAWRVKFTEATKCLFLSSLELKPHSPSPFLKIENFKPSHKQKFFGGGGGDKCCLSPSLSPLHARADVLCRALRTGTCFSGNLIFWSRLCYQLANGLRGPGKRAGLLHGNCQLWMWAHTATGYLCGG